MEILGAFVEQGFLTKTSATLLENYAKKWQVCQVTSILDCHIMSEGELADTLSEVLLLERVYALKAERIKSEGSFCFSLEEALEFEAVLLEAASEHNASSMVIGAVNPLSPPLKAFLAEKCPQDYVFVVCERSQLIASILEAYPVQSSIKGLMPRELEKGES